MKFVTKDEFEKALATIELALKNNQLKYGHYGDENPAIASKLLFVLHDDSLVESNKISFIAPIMAAKEVLLRTRQDLTLRKVSADLNVKLIERLEKEEKELVNVLITLKE